MTLIESIISVVLLGMVLVGLLAGLVTGIISTRRAEDNTFAIILARSQLEDTLSQSYTEPPDYTPIYLPEGYSISFPNGDKSVINSTLMELVTVKVYTATRILLETTTLKVNSSYVASPVPTIARDDFESDGWTGGAGWLNVWQSSGDASVVSSDTPYQGRYHLMLRRNTGYAARGVDLSGKTTVRLQFWAMAESFGPGDTATVSVSSNGTIWIEVKTWGDGEADNIYRPWDIDLSAHSKTSTFWIAFDTNMSRANARLYIDYLKIIGE